MSPLLRWYISSSAFGVPQAAGPIAFSLVALSLTGETSGGAAMMLAMTLALLSIALLAAYEASFTWLIVLAAIAGSVNGAAHGYLRAVLNHLAPASRLPRTLGIAATLNELTFVLAPVAASGLGTVSPVFAVLVLALVGAVPALLVPNTGSTHIADVSGLQGSLLSRSVVPWLMCATVGSAAVAAIEIGAVALALNFGYEPALAILFTVPLCLASVAGGIWVSVRNRMATRKAVLAQLFIMTLGSVLAALNLSVTTTVIATVLIGSVLAPLSTSYSLSLAALAPPQRRAEVFALLRTANATGVIFASAVLTVVSLSMALMVVTGLMIIVTLVVGIASVRPAS